MKCGIKHIIIVLVFFTNCNAKMDGLKTVGQIDLEKYQGKWYEIANYPTKFQKGCSCTTAEYTITQKGKISCF